MPGEQCFQLSVPNTNVTLTAGAGAVDGITITTDKDEFFQALGEVIVESKGDMRLVSTGVLAAAASNGIFIGTPGTIQAAAGGGVQIYAGATVSVAIGAPGAPGDPFKAPKPAKVNAGAQADRLNRFNDGVKGVGDVVGGALDWKSAENKYEKAKAAFDMAKGTWDVAKSGNAHVDEKGETKGWAKVVDGTVKVGELGFGFLDSGLPDDATTRVAAAAGVLGKIGGMMEAGGKPMSGDAIKAAEAAQAAIANAGTAGGGIAGPSDGPRIHEVAPANIDRECGANMTAKVAGDKTTAVDGKIEYTSGASITMKAFTKVETQSLFFEAHANIKAVMKGLASATVESLGSAKLEGKAKATVASMVKAKVEAPKVEIAAKAALDVTSPAITIGSGNLTINSVTKITKQVTVGAKVKVDKDIKCDGKTEVKGDVKSKGTVQAKKDVKASGKIKNGSLTAN